MMISEGGGGKGGKRGVIERGKRKAVGGGIVRVHSMNMNIYKNKRKERDGFLFE
jgi:hypothetical protein